MKPSQFSASGPEALKQYLARFDFLTEALTDRFVRAFAPATVQKRQFIVQPEFTAKFRNYVVEGAFRSYVVCSSGNEHTISFAIEDWWISDYNSYIYQTPATQFVVAIEDSLIMRIGFEEEQALKAEHHHFESVFRIMAERGLAFHHRRLVANLTQSAEARYHQFVNTYPHLVGRIPQYALASFLGMTPEFFSKIKNNRV